MEKCFGGNLLNWLRDYFLVSPFSGNREKPASFLVESEKGELQTLSLEGFEEKFAISYLPSLEFLKPSYYRAFFRKTLRYDRKGFLDHQQRWLGAYFRKEILSQLLPPVCLRWINSNAGWGVFAERDLKPLEFIGEYTGIVRKRKKADEKNAYCFEYPVAKEEITSYVIDAERGGNITRFLNHSENPNLSTTLAIVDHLPHIIFYTKHFIPKGTQLCYYYGFDYWKKRSAPQDL
jgi:hypothetical protein